MPLITEYYGRNHSSGNASLNFFLANSLYYERTSSQNFTFYTSSTNQATGYAGNYRYGDSVMNFNIYNESSSTNYVSIYVGTAAASTSGQGGYIVYKVRVAPYVSFTPINTDNRIFVHGGTSIYISTTVNVTMNYTMCINRFRS